MSDLSIEEVANRRNVSVSTVRRWIKRGLPSYKEGNIIRISETDEEDWINERKSKDILSDKILKEILTSSGHSNIDEAGGVMATKKKGRRHFAYGSIYQRKPGGSWTIDYRNPQGKRIQQVVKGVTNWQEAHESLKRTILREYFKEDEEGRKKQGIGFKDFADKFYHDCMITSRRNYKSDEYRMEMLKEFFKDMGLRAITPLMIEGFRKTRLNKGNSKATVNRYVALLKRMFNVAIDEGYLESNPAARIKLYSEGDTVKERILTEEEERRLLKESSPMLRSVLLTMLNGGLRPSEIFSLKWSQINFKERVLTVERTKSGKTRYIPINQALFEELIRLKAKANGQGPYAFFNEKTGKPITTVRTAFRAACRRSGVSGIRLYDARHTFASRLVRYGVDIESIRSLLGHSDIKITQRYTHSNEAVKRSAVELLSPKKGLARDKLVTNRQGDISGNLPIHLFTVN